MNAAKTSLIDNRGDSLFTTIYPREASETIVLLHGGPGCPDDFTDIVEQLADRYQVITFHQRGTRKSPCPSGDYSMEKYISDIEAIASHFDLGKFHLFGHSWGGLYAQIYAQLHPKRLLSLFLCSPGCGTGSQWKLVEREIVSYNRSKTPTLAWMMMGLNTVLGMMGNDAAYQRLFKQATKNYNKDFSVSSTVSSVDFKNIKATAVNQTRKEIMGYPLLKSQIELDLPVTINYGDHDIFGDSKNYVLQRFSSARKEVIKNSGHFPWLHNPSAFATILKNHFSNLSV